MASGPGRYCDDSSVTFYVGADMVIDIEKLREDMKEDCYGAYFAGGFGAALVESFDVDRASPEELIKMVEKKGIDLRRYIEDEEESEDESFL